MFGFAFELLSEFGAALLYGERNALRELIEHKLEHAGEEFLKEAVPGFDIAKRARRAAETGGASEFQRLRAHWLQGFKPPSVATAGAMPQGSPNDFTRKTGSYQLYGKTRDSWLQNAW